MARRGVVQAENTARGAANSQAMQWLARLGYAAKGVLYVIIGVLAAQIAFGLGGQLTDQKGALRAVAALPFGQFLLVLVIIGLVGFGLWSLIQAIFDTEAKGREAKGIIARIGYAIVGVTYLVLAYGAYQLIAGSGNGGGSSHASAQDATASLPTAVVVIVGLIILGVAIYLFAKAYTAKFLQRFNLSGAGKAMKDAVKFMGRFGYAALGVVFTIIGIFLIVAAVQHDPSKAKGLDSALVVLQNQQPFGPLLLGIVALGLIAYGIYSFMEARYRIIGRA